MTLGEKIKFYRKNRGLTQKELGQATNIHEVAIRKYELDKVRPRPEQLEKISQTLNIPMNVFLDFEFNKDGDVFPLLFAIDEAFPLKIIDVDGTPAIQFTDKNFDLFLRDWQSLKEMIEAGVETQDNYEFWKAMRPGYTKIIIK